MDIAKINPNTQKGKHIIVVSQMAEDVATTWHATIGHVEKKTIASACSRVVSLPGRNEEWRSKSFFLLEF